MFNCRGKVCKLCLINKHLVQWNACALKIQSWFFYVSIYAKIEITFVAYYHPFSKTNILHLTNFSYEDCNVPDYYHHMPTSLKNLYFMSLTTHYHWCGFWLLTGVFCGDCCCMMGLNCDDFDGGGWGARFSDCGCVGPWVGPGVLGCSVRLSPPGWLPNGCRENC